MPSGPRPVSPDTLITSLKGGGCRVLRGPDRFAEPGYFTAEVVGPGQMSHVHLTLFFDTTSERFLFAYRDDSTTQIKTMAGVRRALGVLDSL